MGVRKFIARKLVRGWIAAAMVRQRNRAPEDRLRLIWTSLSQDTLLRWLFWRLPMTNPRENRNSYFLSQILRHSPDLKDTVVLHVPRELQKALDRQNAHLLLQAH
jgi:hypothetical protein